MQRKLCVQHDLVLGLWARFAQIFLWFGTRIFWPAVQAKLCADFCADFF